MRSKFTAAFAAFALVASAAVVAAAQGGGKDFGGVWVLDAAKSEGVMQGAEETMTVKQDKHSFTVESKLKTPRGERTMNAAFAADGKEGDFTVRLGPNEAKGKRTAKWADDGKTLEVVEAVDFQTPDGNTVNAKTTRKWSLSDDGKTLTVEENREGGMRAGKSKRVYTKQ